MNVTKDIFYVGVNDLKVDLFEGQYTVPNGMCYNSYLISDEKIAVMDTVDKNFTAEWLTNIKTVSAKRAPDYLIVQHMEPDHSASIKAFMDEYPSCTIVSSAKAFSMIAQFFGNGYEDRKITVKEGDTLCLGSHELSFVAAPMVHWPEVIVTYDKKEKLLFSADAFGRFGAYGSEGNYLEEARRYFIGIVGKYGSQVQALLKKASTLDIEIICPLHGEVITENLDYYINLYNTWSSYRPETEGILIAYASIYGNTKKAAEFLFEKCKENGIKNIEILDLARTDKAKAVAKAFQYSKIVLASSTYNNSLFPPMRIFLEEIKERNFQNRFIGIIENGTWAPTAAKNIKKALEECKNLTFAETTVTLRSAMNTVNESEISALLKELL